MTVAEKHNFYRLSLLILDAGTPVLRRLFEKQYQTTCNLQALMSSKKRVVNDLCRRKIISQNQKDLLLPNTGCGPSLDDLDISLLSTLLTNLFSIRPPICVWGTEPAATDTSIGADILRLRNARNKLYAHRVNSKINDCEFQQAWSNICGSISRLSNQLDQQHREDIQNKIFNAQEAHIDYAREKEIDSMIFTTEIKAISETLEKLNGIISHQEVLDRDLTSVRIVISEDQSEEDSKFTPTDDTGIENLTGLPDGQDGIICVVKQYRYLKSDLPRAKGVAIAGRLLEQKLISKDEFERMVNASTRRLCIDSLLKKVILKEVEFLQCFFRELKSVCPQMAKKLADTNVTEENRKEFKRLEDRAVGEDKVSYTGHVRCSMDDGDVRFFQYHLCDSHDVLDELNDLLLSRFCFSAQDHSKLMHCSQMDEKIRSIFETIWSCHLDTEQEFQNVLGSPLYHRWIQFRNDRFNPGYNAPGILQSLLDRIQGFPLPLVTGIFRIFRIRFLEAWRGSIVLKFLAEDDFNIELLKPELMKMKIKELLKRSGLDLHTLQDTPVHLTVFILSPNSTDKEEIHLHLDLEAKENTKEENNAVRQLKLQDETFMKEEMDPEPLQHWLSETFQMDSNTKDKLNCEITQEDISRKEKMGILLDLIRTFENGFHMLETYCAENDRLVYDKVFLQPLRLSRTPDGHQGNKLEFKKGGGLQKIFSIWLDLCEDERDKDISFSYWKTYKKCPFLVPDYPVPTRDVNSDPGPKELRDIDSLLHPCFIEPGRSFSENEGLKLQKHRAHYKECVSMSAKDLTRLESLRTGAAGYSTDSGFSSPGSIWMSSDKLSMSESDLTRSKQSEDGSYEAELASRNRSKSIKEDTMKIQKKQQTQLNLSEDANPETFSTHL